MRACKKAANNRQKRKEQREMEKKNKTLNKIQKIKIHKNCCVEH